MSRAAAHTVQAFFPAKRPVALDLLATRKAAGTGVLLISHDLAVVARLADRIAVMYQGRFVEEGTVEEVLLTPRHPYTRELLAAVPAAAGRADPAQRPRPAHTRHTGGRARLRLRTPLPPGGRRVPRRGPRPGTGGRGPGGALCPVAAHRRAVAGARRPFRQELFARPRHPYTRALLTALPRPEDAWRRPVAVPAAESAEARSWPGFSGSTEHPV
ncbi:ABC transporter ATP-binding protein [Streptomyces turgidiscabies]|uniref:ABC-type glutathione transport system ATPase component n=1 Tax=Streptomyces turgidiscabies TaxID=85558 RepID=A0ABU0S0R5_9ACTN|nr:hypothetical protein [Streptomyces turgidiscabies]MDQ0936750.1 ABC-type glutathione transport system ATPase component [Streptomyces turgidiscabies]